jgi:D-threo-aldose 1-dehydrogenase
MAIRLDELRRIGNSDVAVSPLGFGGNVLGNLYATVEEDEALDTVAAAYESFGAIRVTPSCFPARSGGC